MSIDPFEMHDDYSNSVHAKLEDILQHYQPSVVVSVIRKIVENLVITERLVQKKGIHIEEIEKRRLLEREFPDIQAEVDRALGGVIGSILSREGA